MKYYEDYEVQFESEDELIEELNGMERETMWFSGIVSSDLSVDPVLTPLEAGLVAEKYRLEYERTYYNTTEGTKLILITHNQNFNISPVSWATMLETAKLGGVALQRMDAVPLSQCINNGLDVARGESVVLVRYGMVMAMHGSNYSIMPIDSLLRHTRKSLEERFGTVTFWNAIHNNRYTEATWILPDVQNDMIEKYQKVLENTCSPYSHAINFMPAARFSSSDTSHASASLRPLFIADEGTPLYFGGAIKVRHEKTRNADDTEETAMTLYIDKSKQLFAQFDETIENIEKMANTEIENPENTFVGICNALNRGGTVIPRRIADEAREELSQLVVMSPVLTMHDIYIALCSCVSIAKRNGAKNTFTMEEAIARVLSYDWKNFDIGGVVAWGSSTVR